MGVNLVSATILLLCVIGLTHLRLAWPYGLWAVVLALVLFALASLAVLFMVFGLRGGEPTDGETSGLHLRYPQM
jgi:hypothetical protein